jgi:hypothetical protein
MSGSPSTTNFHRTFSSDTTTVPVDNTLHGCQSDPGSGKLVVQVETLMYPLEHLFAQTEQ